MMDDEIHKEIVNDTAELRELVQKCSTSYVINFYYSFSIGRSLSGKREDYLISPAKQWYFLLGILMSSSEPSEPSEFNDNLFRKSTELLNRIFWSYTKLFYPQDGEEVNDGWVRAREVAMPAFLSYFNQGLLASTDQIANRVEKYFTYFDEVLRLELGLSASNTVSICRAITKQLQTSVIDLADASQREKKLRQTFLERAKNSGWDLPRMREEAQKDPVADAVYELFDRMSRLANINIDSIKYEFGNEIVDAFLKLFSIARGGGHELNYMTERSIAEERSIYISETNDYLCPCPNLLYLAALSQFEKYLTDSSSRESYYRHRDAIFEDEVLGLFKKFMGEKAEYFFSVFETDDNQFEHDLIIKYDRTVLVVESKARPPKEPFRDPEKAFVRLQHEFGNESGIQGAYEQTRRIWRFWNSGETVRLYNEDRNIVFQFSKNSIDEVFMVCITRENFGPLAIDLSILLEKDVKDPYPWAVNIFDLEAIIDAWDYFSWDVTRFFEFLRGRNQLHGKILAGDELEVVGFFVHHGSYEKILEAVADCLFLKTSYSDIFDKIFRARQGGEDVKIESTPPLFYKFEPKAIGEEILSHELRDASQEQKQGRNKKCACGSGKKYKHCCGR